MGFLDDLLNGGSSFLPFPLPGGGNGNGNGGGFFDPGGPVEDVLDWLKRLRERDDFTSPGPVTLPEPGPGPPDLNGGGQTNGQLRTTGATTSMYIGGNCPGLWHNTKIRPLYDHHTGAFIRNVGGNRVANRVSLVQDDSGALEFFGPLKATFTLKHKPRRRHHHHRARRHHHHKRVSAHHHHRRRHHHHGGLTTKQLKAGFGGKSRM